MPRTTPFLFANGTAECLEILTALNFGVLEKQARMGCSGIAKK